MNKFIFSFGLHGSGHHMTNDILNPLLFDKEFNKETYNINFDKKLRSQLNSFYTPYIDNKIKSSNVFDVYLKNKISKKMNQILESGYKRFYFSSSYTFGTPLSIYGMPSVVDIFDVVQNVKDLELKIIFLNRDIKDCTKSILRRKFETNSLNAAFITHLAALEVENSIDFLKKINNQYCELNYHELILNSQNQILKLMEYLELNKQQIDLEGFKSNINKQNKDRVVDAFFKNRIYRFIENLNS